MEKEKKLGKKKTFLLAILVVGMVWAAGSGLIPHIEQDPTTLEWKVVWEGNFASAAEADPGSGATGFLEIFCYPHDGDPGTTYAENNSATLEAAALAYASADNFEEDLDSETAFDIVVRARFNQTHCWDGSKFVDTRCRCKITTSNGGAWLDGEDISDVEGTAVVSANETAYDFIYINFYWNAEDNNGYQLLDDGSFDVTEISIEAKF